MGTKRFSISFPILTSASEEKYRVYLQAAYVVKPGNWKLHRGFSGVESLRSKKLRGYEVEKIRQTTNNISSISYVSLSVMRAASSVRHVFQFISIPKFAVF
jgi:hypothetical protein